MLDVYEFRKDKVVSIHGNRRWGKSLSEGANGKGGGREICASAAKAGYSRLVDDDSELRVQ